MGAIPCGCNSTYTQNTSISISANSVEDSWWSNIYLNLCIQPWNMNMTMNLGFIFMYLFYFFPPSLSPFLFLHALSLSPFLSISIRISQSLCLYLSFPFFYPFLFLVYVIPYSPFCYISISTHLFIKSFVK